MSKYSGKCDVYDHFCTHNKDIEEQLKNSYICVGKAQTQLELETEAQLALYFPYTIATGSWDSEFEKSHLWLSEHDYVRSSEIEMIDFYVHEAKKEKAFCKKHKIQYSVDDVYKKRFSWTAPENKKALLEIIQRVEAGGRQKYDDIRLPSYDFCRNIWLEDLINIYKYPTDFATAWVWDLK